MNEGIETNLLRLEILVASPPTRKCKAIISMFENFLTEFPGKLKLDIYLAGEPMFRVPTDGFKRESGKIRKIPSAYVNGINVASKEVPDEENVRSIIVEELAKLHL